MALNVFKCTHRKPTPPLPARPLQGGGTGGGRLGLLGFAGSLSRTVALCKMLSGENGKGVEVEPLRVGTTVT